MCLEPLDQVLTDVVATTVHPNALILASASNPRAVIACANHAIVALHHTVREHHTLCDVAGHHGSR